MISIRQGWKIIDPPPPPYTAAPPLGPCVAIQDKRGSCLLSQAFFPAIIPTVQVGDSQSLQVSHITMGKKKVLVSYGVDIDAVSVSFLFSIEQR